jgi:hypothetical protein
VTAPVQTRAARGRRSRVRSSSVTGTSSCIGRQPGDRREGDLRAWPAAKHGPTPRSPFVVLTLGLGPLTLRHTRVINFHLCWHLRSVLLDALRRPKRRGRAPTQRTEQCADQRTVQCAGSPALQLGYFFAESCEGSRDAAFKCPSSTFGERYSAEKCL